MANRFRCPGRAQERRSIRGLESERRFLTSLSRVAETGMQGSSRAPADLDEYALAIPARQIGTEPDAVLRIDRACIFSHPLTAGV